MEINGVLVLVRLVPMEREQITISRHIACGGLPVHQQDNLPSNLQGPPLRSHLANLQEVLLVCQVQVPVRDLVVLLPLNLVVCPVVCLVSCLHPCLVGGLVLFQVLLQVLYRVLCQVEAHLRLLVHLPARYLVVFLLQLLLQFLPLSLVDDQVDGLAEYHPLDLPIYQLHIQQWLQVQIHLQVFLQLYLQ